MIILVAKKRYPFHPHHIPLSSLPFLRRIATFLFFNIQSNLSTTATLGTEEIAVVETCSQESMFGFFVRRGRKKVAGRCREVAVSGGWTVLVTGFPGVVILSFNRIVGGKVFIKKVSFIGKL